MQRASRYIVFFLITTLSFSCSKDKSIQVNATVIDLTGRLDGCGLLLQMDDGHYLEPVKSPAGTQLIPGRRVSIRYKTVDRMSICMAGPMVEITSLRYL
jgi:hypothetical protein